VLDAPELQDDFYLNLVDWSSQNVLSVGLGSCVYLWSACTSQVTRLCDLSSDGNSVTAVSWNERVSTLLPLLVSVVTDETNVTVWNRVIWLRLVLIMATSKCGMSWLTNRSTNFKAIQLVLVPLLGMVKCCHLVVEIV
jgi:hypothetical protein